MSIQTPRTSERTARRTRLAGGLVAMLMVGSLAIPAASSAGWDKFQGIELVHDVTFGSNVAQFGWQVAIDQGVVYSSAIVDNQYTILAYPSGVTGPGNTTLITPSLGFGTMTAGAGTIVLGDILQPSGFVVIVLHPDGSGAFEEEIITSPDSSGADRFGSDGTTRPKSVALDPDSGVLIIGAPSAVVSGNATGAAYVFMPNGAGRYTDQPAKLVASDANHGDLFGRSVAIDGDTIVIGAVNHTATSAHSVGAAYVFKPDGSGGYDEHQLQPENLNDSNKSFGNAVAVDGDNVFVRSHDDISVFTPNATSGYDRVLVDSSAESRSGAFLATSGFVVNGNRDGAGAEDPGSVIVYSMDSPGTYIREEITPSVRRRWDLFGIALAAEGATLVVGSPYLSPAAYVYQLGERPTCDGVAATVDLGLGQAPTSSADVIVGTSFDDVIDGLGGDDLICGGPGRDFIYGGDGDDSIYGDHDVDRIWGQGGDDLLFGNGGSDRLHGGPGADELHGGSGADRMYGAGGADLLLGMGGQDRMYGGSGNDLMQGNHQTDILDGGTGNDDLRGAGGKDKLYGGAGDDVLYGGNNTDYLEGGDGDDLAHGQLGRDNPLIPDVSGCDAETVVSC